jgi:hypothetical protein
MIKRFFIFTIVFVFCSVSILTFLDKKLNSNTNLSYEWEILSDKNIILHNTFSWQYKSNEEYDINHDIHIKQKQSNVMNIILRQTKTQWSQNIRLQDYSILTGQWNHRLTIFEQEFLKKNKHKTLSWIQNLSGVEYQSNYKKWLFLDTLSLQWSYTNQLNQKNYYTIILKINCGITQYITNKQKCTINWEIWLDLPINTYTKTWYIQWILYKQPMI